MIVVLGAEAWDLVEASRPSIGPVHTGVAGAPLPVLSW